MVEIDAIDITMIWLCLQGFVTQRVVANPRGGRDFYLKLDIILVTKKEKKSHLRLFLRTNQCMCVHLSRVQKHAKLEKKKKDVFLVLVTNFWKKKNMMEN